MRFIHTSDWHLGRVYYGLRLTDDQAYALAQIEDVVKDTKPDVLLVSGDIYDRSVPPVDAVDLLDDFLQRIVREHKVPVVLIAGNHDGPARMSFASQFLSDQDLHIVGTLDEIAPIVIEDKHGPVEIFGIPYADPPEVRNAHIGEDVRDHDAATEAVMSACLKRRSSDRAIALAHAFVSGGKVSESERRLSVGGTGEVRRSRFKGFDYVALGHLHRPQTAGAETIRYSGSLLKYSFSEAGDKKGVIIGEIDAKGSVTTEFTGLDPLHDVRCISGKFKDLNKPTGTKKSREDYLEITLTDRGPILDAMERLRKIYPNLLNIRRPNLQMGDDIRLDTPDPRKVDHIEMFSSFFEQVTGGKMSQKEKKAFADILKEVHDEIGGVA